MTNAQRYPDLMKAELLDGLGEFEKSAFLNGSTVESYQISTPVLIQDQLFDGVVMVAEGSVEVRYTGSDGNTVVMYHAAAGTILGAVEAMAKKPCAATCTAFANASLLICPDALLQRYLQIPRFMRNISTTIYDALRRNNELKKVDQFYTAEQRICSYLAQLAKHSRHIQQSQAYVANVVGYSRQTVNKEFGYLKDRGVLAVSKGRIEILDADALTRRIKDLDQS